LPWSVLLVTSFLIKNETMSFVVRNYLGFVLIVSLALKQIHGSYQCLLPLGKRSWLGGILVLIVFLLITLVSPLIGLLINPAKYWEFFTSAIREPVQALSQLGVIGLAAGILQFLGSLAATLKSMLK